MNRGFPGLLVVLLLIGLLSSAAYCAECLTCHKEKTPFAVLQWEKSAHGKSGVGCEACHGTDHTLIDRGEARVDITVCGHCHGKALSEHQASRHGMALHSGWGCTRNLAERKSDGCRFCHEKGSEIPVSQVQCARFLKQSSEMAEIGCTSCHAVENSCASCHTGHGTELAIVRNPVICAKCHMGPDHPQWEMWQTSLHGTLFSASGRENGPDCQSCHMPSGSHNVSRGITCSSAGKPYDPVKQEGERQEMLRICSRCHAPSFARKELQRDDAVGEQSRKLVVEAEKIVADLAEHSLLDPMPDKRPPHPLNGSNLVLDSQMLYEDTSHIERLLFKMKKYDFAKTVKGAYHQNPAYAHWYGNAELKMDLVDIKSEAGRLKERRQAGGAACDSRPGNPLEENLRALKRKLERKELTPAEFEQQKQLLLK